jgi:ATP-dependent helicase HrpB
MAFLDPPPAPAWAEAVALLRRLEALDTQGRITGEGRALSRLPLHPRLAHMIHRAAQDGDAMNAALLAVVLGERGLGGHAVDIGVRLDQLRTDRAKRANEARGLAPRRDDG